MSLLNRFSKKEQIIPVYAVGVIILYSWAIVTTLRDLDSNWSLYFNVSDILTLFAYVIAGAFLESLTLIGILLLISFALPTTMFTRKFVLHGTIFVLTILGSIMYLYTKTWPAGVLENIRLWSLFFVTSTVVFVFLGESLSVVRKAIGFLADRCIVFLYIYMPISFLSIVVIIIRNLI